MSLSSFFLLAGIGIALLLFFPLWWLIPFDLLQIHYFGGWALGTLRVGPGDLMAVLVMAGLLLRGDFRFSLLRRLEWMGPWLALALLFSISYVLAPVNQRSLTGAERYLYQLFVYCWRPLLFYPFCLLLLRSPKRAYIALYCALFAALSAAIEAIFQGYAGVSSAPGPFRTGNQLGGVLIMPMVIAVAGALLPRDRRQLLISLASIAILGRAYLFCGSRGGQMAALGGCAFFAIMLMTRHLGRRRLQTLAPFAAILFVALLPAIPILMERPTVAHALTVTEGSKASTMQWRMQERWPHFWAIAVANPLFGIGTAVDTSLGDKANTPHNGFLSMLVTYGFPAFFLILFFAGRGIRNGLALYQRAPNADHRAFGLTLAASIIGILIHQMVEVTLTAPFTFKLFWMVIALSELALRWPDTNDELSVDEIAPRPDTAPEDWYRRWWRDRPRPATCRAMR
jgi:O-antigen ligase